MRTIGLALLFSSLALALAAGQTVKPPGQDSAPPQTARQALLEMLTGGKEDSVQKHLPDATLHALFRKGSNSQTSFAAELSAFASQAKVPGNHLETFDVGSMLLSFEQFAGRQKVEVMVDRDDLQGDEDQIELTIRYYENGEPQILPVIPRFIFLMQPDKNVWKLAKVTVQGEFPLTDPDYLKGLRDQENKSLETMANYGVNQIKAAEAGYAAKNPERGYSCNLNDLFSSTYKQGEAQFFNPELAKGEGKEYRYSVTGCNAAPSSKYEVFAVPIDPDSGLKIYCSDQSGSVRSLSSGKPSSCLSSGQEANTIQLR